jgi:hypothetical protein
MSKSRMTILAAACLILGACGGGGGGTEPRCCATLEGTWVGTEADLTLRIVVGPDISCTHQYGYCLDSGSGTYSRSGEDSGSFVVSGLYFVDIGQSANVNMSDPVTNKTTTFAGIFESATELTGTLYDQTNEPGDTSEPGLLHVGLTGVPMTLRKQ